MATKTAWDAKRLIAAGVVLLVTRVIVAQGIVTGSISGTVLDPQGAVVSGAAIRATQLATNRVFTTTSSSGGVILVPSLPPGGYNIVVEKQGFSIYSFQGAVVEVGKDTALGKISLSVGNIEQTVTVEGSAPIVETTTDQISQTFDNKQIAAVPLGNTYDSFVLFTPGVSSAGSGAFSNNNGAELSINGQRARSNNYQLDGQNNNDNTIGGPSIFFGNQDNIAELQVVTNFDAEYGRNLGGVVNYITKGGTNSFHGTGFEFWQGDHFDSLTNQNKSSLFTGPNGLPFCNPGQAPSSTTCETPVVPQFVQNQFGGTVGGPIERDKLWFFGSTNFQRIRSSGAAVSSTPALTPTANGIQQLQAAYPNDPAVAFLSQWAPVALTIGEPVISNVQNVTVTPTLFDGSPAGLPTSTVEMGVISRFLSQPFNDYEGTGRVDYQVTDKDRFFTRYIFQQTLTTNIPVAASAGAAAGQIIDVAGRSQQIALDYIHTFSPSFLNGVRFGYSRSSSEFDGGGFPNCLLVNIGACPPQITILAPDPDGTQGLGIGQNLLYPQGRIINVYELQDNASTVRGKHVMKWGGEYDKQRSPNYGLFNINGAFTYQNFDSFIANSPNPATTAFAYGQPVVRFKENDLAFYYQDDWRARDNLTLNLGLRWEFFQQASNLLHDQSVAQQTGPNALWSTNLALSLTTVPKLPNHYHNFGPVVGFAWTPRILPSLLGQNKTVIRGGFRIAYDFAYYNLSTNAAGTAPFTNFATFSSGVPSVSSYDGATIAAALFSQAPKGNPGFATELQFGPNFRNPYSEQWNLGIQRQIGNRIAAEVRYVGNHDLAQFQEINGNPDILPLVTNGLGNSVPRELTPCTIPAAPGSTGTDQFENPVGYVNCNFSRVIEYANTGFSIYNGLQSQFRLKDFHGFTGEISYTWSHLIDNASEAFSTLTGTFNAIAQNPFDISRAERANSNYNYPNDFTALWVYDLPFRKAQQGMLGHLLGGWQITGTYRYNSGQPYTMEQNAGQGLCDPTNFTGGTIDACRPFPGNPSAPFSAVGSCTSAATPGCGLVNIQTGNPVSLSQVRWITNNIAAEQFFGTPFSPLGRNTERGQPVSTINFAVFKNFKINERVTFQFQAEAFNLFNHMWLGIPIQNVNDSAVPLSASEGVPLLGSLKFNGDAGDTFAGNVVTDGEAQRRLQFGAKIIF